MLRHLHPHRLNIRGAAEQKKALPEPSRYAVAEGVAIAVEVLDVGVRRYGGIAVVLQQLMVGQHEHRAMRSVARKHKGGR